MVKILEFKEFKSRLNPIYEDDAPAPEPPPPAPAGDAGAAPAPAPLPPPPPVDMGAAPTLPPDPTAAPAAPGAETDYKFVFIQDAPNTKWKSEEFKTMELVKYSITPAELDEWIKDHTPNTADPTDFANNIKAGITGSREMGHDVYKRFKDEVKSGSAGTNMGTIEIKFEDTDFKSPSTDSNNLNVVFIKSNKSNQKD
jgi:hypothetical protein